MTTDHKYRKADKTRVCKLQEALNSYQQLTHCIKLTWDATEDCCETSIMIGNDEIACWKPVYWIEAEDIAFKSQASDPDEIFFLKIEE